MNKQKSNSRAIWIDRIEILIIVATAIVSGLVSLLDFLGVLDGVPWLANRVPTLTLLVGGLIAGYLAFERLRQLEPIQEDLHKGISDLKRVNAESASMIIESLKGVEVRSFADGHDLIYYLNARLLEAQVQVDDLTWTPAGRSLDIGLDKAQKPAQENFEHVIRIAKKIPYREVFVFNTISKITKFQRLLAEELPGYSCAYYETEANVPVFTFVIIDKEEVFLFSPQCYLAFKHPQMVQFFVGYYEKIWDKAIPLKSGISINEEAVRKVLNTANVT